MPIVSIEGDWLNQLLGRSYPIEELADALEQIGCDVDEVLDIERFRCPNCKHVVEGSLGAETTNRCNWCLYEQPAGFVKIGQSRVIRLDLLAARPDLFDIGGIARALKGYLGQVAGLPEYRVQAGTLQVIVDASVDTETCHRPYIRCAVIELPPIDDARLVSLMKLQEALHWGVGRDRKLASIGAYDLDTIRGPLSYTTIDPDNESFTPLGLPGTRMTGREILEKHPKGVAYARLLADHQRYPVLKDSQGRVLSMPPIINSEETKVQAGTKRLFVDVTGISESAVVKSLDTFVSSLLELGGSAQAVTIVQANGTQLTSPNLQPRELQIELGAARRWLGLPLNADNLVQSLRRMRLDAAPVDGDPNRFTVRYPALRTDFKHMVDLFEDLAIGFGYRNIQPTYAGQMTTGEPRPEERQSHLVRSVLLGLGFSEIMSLPMTTQEAHFEHFRNTVPQHYPRIANPKLKAMTVVRTHLMTGLMEHLRENRRAPMPLRFFELDNTVTLDAGAQTGAREERRLGIVDMGPEASYASIRAIVDALLFELGLQGEYIAAEDPAFIPGRLASVQGGSAKLGVPVDFHGRLGELHPETLINFGLDYPVSIADVCLLRVV